MNSPYPAITPLPPFPLSPGTGASTCRKGKRPPTPPGIRSDGLAKEADTKQDRPQIDTAQNNSLPKPPEGNSISPFPHCLKFPGFRFSTFYCCFLPFPIFPPKITSQSRKAWRGPHTHPPFPLADKASKPTCRLNAVSEEAFKSPRLRLRGVSRVLYQEKEEGKSGKTRSDKRRGERKIWKKERKKNRTMIKKTKKGDCLRHNRPKMREKYERDILKKKRQQRENVKGEQDITRKCGKN